MDEMRRMTARLGAGLPATVVLALLLIVGVAAWRGLQLGPPVVGEATLGAEFPDFRLRRLSDDAWLDVKDLPQEPFVLNVWASWCPTCVVEHPFLSELASEGVPLVGLNYHDDRAQALEWLAARGDPMRFHISDPRGTLAVALGVTGAPETFVIDAQGVIARRHLGELHRRVWERHLRPALEGR